MRFAFSQEQFNEVMKEWGLHPKKDLDKIARIPFGGFIQKKDAPLMHETFARHHRELQAAIDADPTGEGFIKDMFLYELENHEYSYTGTVEDALDSLGSPSRMWWQTPGWPVGWIWRSKRFWNSSK